MSFLHFETQGCYTDILFYDFYTNSIEILWYCKFDARSKWTREINDLVIGNGD